MDKDDDAAQLPTQGVAEPAGVELQIEPAEYQALTGEGLAATLDINTWQTGVEALQDYDRLEREIEEAARLSTDLRRTIRNDIFKLLPNAPGAPVRAGVYSATIDDIKETQRNVLFNGLVEACDGNSHVFHTLPMQIIQIAVAAVSYLGEEATWANRIFRRDIPFKPGQSVVEQTIDLLEKRAGDKEGGRRKVTDMMRRAVMTFMERCVLADKSKAPWRMGHGNPLAYELLTGSGLADLIHHSVPVLERLVLDHKKFVFVPSDTVKEHFLTIGDALNPLEYAVISDSRDDLQKILDGGYRGQKFLDAKSKVLEPFCKRAGPEVILGVYRASLMGPAKMFYAHRDYIDEAAHIALADSVMQEHRGCPLLIDMADGICRTYFGADTLNRPTQAGFAHAGEPYRYLSERSTRS